MSITGNFSFEIPCLGLAGGSEALDMLRCIPEKSERDPCAATLLLLVLCGNGDRFAGVLHNDVCILD